MRRSLFAPALLAALALCPALAHADDIRTFTLNATYGLNGASTPAGNITGTLSIDATTGALLSESFSTPFDGYTNTTYFGIGTWDGSQSGTSPNVYFGENAVTPPQYSTQLNLNLFLPTASLVGYNGGSLCTNATPCASAISDINHHTDYNLISGALSTSVAPTPEPSSLVLLGSGAFGLLGLVRRRLHK